MPAADARRGGIFLKHDPYTPLMPGVRRYPKA